MLIQSPQQSPPSKVQSADLASLLQNPLPINANGAAQLRSSKHMHSVQYCVSTFDPQQSPPSKWHSSLFVVVGSSQYPSPIQLGSLEQPVDLNMWLFLLLQIYFYIIKSYDLVRLCPKKCLCLNSNRCGLFGQIRMRGAGQKCPLRDSGLWMLQFIPAQQTIFHLKAYIFSKKITKPRKCGLFGPCMSAAQTKSNYVEKNVAQIIRNCTFTLEIREIWQI